MKPWEDNYETPTATQETPEFASKISDKASGRLPWEDNFKAKIEPTTASFAPPPRIEDVGFIKRLAMAGVASAMGSTERDAARKQALEQFASKAGMYNQQNQIMAEYAPAAIASTMFPAAALEPALGAAMSQVGARAIPAMTQAAASTFQGRPVSEAAQAAVLAGAAPLAQPTGFSGAKTMTQTIMDYAKGGAMGARDFGAVGFLGEATRQLIEPGELDLKKALKTSAIVSPAGGVTGLVAAGSGRAIAQADRAKAIMAEAKKVFGNDVNITLGMADPENWAQIEAALERTNPAMREQLNAFGATQAERFANLMKAAKSDIEVGAMLKPIELKVQDTNNRIRQLETEYVGAEDIYNKALQAKNRGEAVTSKQVAAAALASVEAQAASIGEKARSMYLANKAAGLNGTPKAASDMAKNVQLLTETLHEARSQASKRLYEATGIPMEERFINVKDVLNSIESGVLKGRKDALAEKIRNAVNMSGDGEKMSMIEYQALRANMAQGFADTDRMAVKAADVLFSDAYRAATASVEKQIIGGNLVGKEMVDALKTANKYWADTSNAMNSRFNRGLLRDEVGAQTMKTIARDIVEGDFSEFESFMKYAREIDKIVDIDKQAPSVGALAHQGFMQALKESMIESSRMADKSKIDLQKLYTQAKSIGSYGKIPVEALGFGSPEQINQVLGTFQKYSNGRSGIMAADLDSILSNPLVREYIAANKKIPAENVDRVVARTFLGQKVREDVLSQRIGLRSKVDTAKEIESLANKAKVSKNEYNSLVQQARSDPMFEVFDSVSFGLPKQSGEKMRSIKDTIMNMTPEKAGQTMEALRKSHPEIASEMEARLTRDFFQDALVHDTRNPNSLYAVDPDKVRKFFSKEALADGNSPIHWAKATLSPETFKRFENMTDWFANYSKYLRIGKGGTAVSPSEQAAAALTALSMDKSVGYGILIGRSIDMFTKFANEKRYNIVSRMVTDPKFAEAYVKTGGNLQAAVKSLAPQRGYLMMMDKDLLDNQDKR